MCLKYVRPLELCLTFYNASVASIWTSIFIEPLIRLILKASHPVSLKEVAGNECLTVNVCYFTLCLLGTERQPWHSVMSFFSTVFPGINFCV